MLVAQVIPAVLAGERLDRVGTQVGARRGSGDCGPDLRAYLAGTPASRVADVEDRGAGVLADGGGVPPGQFDVFQNAFQRAARRRPGGFVANGLLQGDFDIRRQICGCQTDQLQNRFGQVLLHACLRPLFLALYLRWD